AYGGGTEAPSYAIGFLRDGAWRMTTAKRGEIGPLNPNWGDYMWLCPDTAPGRSNYFLGVGFASDRVSGASSGGLEPNQAPVQFVRFRRNPSPLTGAPAAVLSEPATKKDVLDLLKQIGELRKEIEDMKRNDRR